MIAGGQLRDPQRFDTDVAVKMRVLLAGAEELRAFAAREDDRVGQRAQMILRERIAFAKAEAAGVFRGDVGNAIGRAADCCLGTDPDAARTKSSVR